MLQNGWVSVGLVGEQLADMVAHGSLTAQQVLDALAPLDANQQLAVVTNILAHNGTTESAFVSSFAALTLLVWGVAPTSQVYTAMHDALTQVVPDFVGLVRGTTSAANAINDIKAIATSTGVSVDLLLLSVYQCGADGDRNRDLQSHRQWLGRTCRGGDCARRLAFAGGRGGVDARAGNDRYHPSHCDGPGGDERGDVRLVCRRAFPRLEHHLAARGFHDHQCGRHDAGRSGVGAGD
jgi:hypothetical protein